MIIEECAWWCQEHGLLRFMEGDVDYNIGKVLL